MNSQSPAAPQDCGLWTVLSAGGRAVVLSVLVLPCSGTPILNPSTAEFLNSRPVYYTVYSIVICLGRPSVDRGAAAGKAGKPNGIPQSFSSTRRK
eukprot:COSAG02_NODE_30417_length_551_cov_1.309735_1_plen_94_part_10